MTFVASSLPNQAVLAARKRSAPLGLELVALPISAFVSYLYTHPQNSSSAALIAPTWVVEPFYLTSRKVCRENRR